MYSGNDGSLSREGKLLLLFALMQLWVTSAAAGDFPDLEQGPAVATVVPLTAAGPEGPAKPPRYRPAITPPVEQLAIQPVSAGGPSLLTALSGAWHSWSHFRPWRPADINVYTGTRSFGVGPHPAPFFALLSLVGTATYFALCRLRRRRFRVGTAGVVILACWLALDMFWQLRLVQQVSLTWSTFGRLASEDKLVASNDAGLVRFTRAVKAKIPAADARVFIASASDIRGMHSAYYMAPLNTYWHRWGPELPEPRYLAAGDYLLVIAPSAVRYDPWRGRLLYGAGPAIAIETLYRDRSGLLLRVVQ